VIIFSLSHVTGMIAGGTGVAPMVQIMRAALKRPYSDHLDNLQLLYAAETQEELTFMSLLESLKKDQGTTVMLLLLLLLVFL
jgi:ferredoxin-NADP reductase